MNVIVTGGRGQLGRCLARRGARPLAADQLDVRDRAAIDRALAAYAPELVINAAAYTAVDRAESERDAAFAVNRDGAGHLARGCAARNIALIHVSTDYVFDGTATRPYREDDATAPATVYGASKLAGEQEVLAAGGTVVRTSWLFAPGGPSFVHTMVRLAGERAVLRVVADQQGCPTFGEDLAGALLALAAHRPAGEIFHACNAEPTTWHAFACAIIEHARRYRPLACERIEAITTADYPTPARRPAYSVLDTSRLAALGIALPSWRDGLARMIADELGSER